MIELAVQNIEKYYGAHHVLKGVTFDVQTGERIGLLGKNGSGKTTLLNILAGVCNSDAGEKMIRKGASLGVLEQIPQFPDGYTAYDALCAAYDVAFAIKRQMNALEEMMAGGALSEDLLEKYGRLQQLFEENQGYALEENIKRVCIGLGFAAGLLATEFAALSGGEKTRIMLGNLLLKKPDILLLDEPTNHLDVAALEWLEGFLREYKGAAIVISHDRYFLNQAVNRIVELVAGRAELYNGNYSYYAEEKAARCLRQQEQYAREQKKIRQMEIAAKRMHDWAQRADNPSMHKRAANMEKRIERMEKTERPRQDRQMNARFSERSFSGQEVIVATGLSKAFAESVVIDSLDFTVHKSDGIALLGGNGCGKSTLLKMIIGELPPDSGMVRIGASTRYGYLPQNVTFTQPDLSVLDTVRQGLGVSEGDARRILAKYRFRGEDVYRVITNLSGGEKSRLRLCLLMQEDVNLLLLDEPTNHLDIDSREWLEEALLEFAGAILFVSHDRYFVSKFATCIWELDNGGITEYLDDYDGYRRKKTEAQEPVTPPPAVKLRSVASIPARSADEVALPRQIPGRTGGMALKTAIKTSQEMAKAETAIQELEAALIVLESRMQCCGSDFDALAPLLQQKAEWENERDALYQQWLQANEN